MFNIPMNRSHILYRVQKGDQRDFLCFFNIKIDFASLLEDAMRTYHCTFQHCSTLFPDNLLNVSTWPPLNNYDFVKSHLHHSHASNYSIHPRAESTGGVLGRKFRDADEKKYPLEKNLMKIGFDAKVNDTKEKYSSI